MEGTVILGLGSNKGDSVAILHAALEELSMVLGPLRVAPLYKTVPLHVINQPLFFNTACAGVYKGTPENLLREIQCIEASFGRDRQKEIRWGQRHLDIDILLAGELVYCGADLEIPHPRLLERRFALEPLLQLEPEAIHPANGKKLNGILTLLPDQGVQKISDVI